MTRRIPLLKQKRRGRKKATRISVTAKKQISGTVARFGLDTSNSPILTYRDLATALTRKAGRKINVGTAYYLARGREPQDNDIRRALGLPVFVTIAVCQKCGLAHTAKRCARRVKSFEENAANYDRWLAANAGKLAEIVAWACLASDRPAWRQNNVRAR